MKHKPLFESEHLRLTPIDLDKDSQVISSWTYDLDTAAKLREDRPARPLAGIEIKKIAERWMKDSEDTNRQFLFAIRLREMQNTETDNVIGVLRIMQIEWVHSAAYLDLIISDQDQWQSFAQEALEMALRYAFDELGLFRITAVIAEHNQPANALFEQANFTLEVRQRQTVYWNRRAWDKLYYGLLRAEWKMQQLAEVRA